MLKVGTAGGAIQPSGVRGITFDLEGSPGLVTGMFDASGREGRGEITY